MIKCLFLFSIINIAIYRSEICPKIKCGTLNADTCGKMTYNNQNKEKKVIFQICNNDHKCNFNPDDLKKTSNMNWNCYFPGRQVKYPGELCNSNHLCYLNQECPDDGVCPSKQEGEDCESHLDCGVRLYCHSEEKVCKMVETRLSNCTSDYMCRNSQGCYKGYCTNYYSLPLGTEMTDSQSEFKQNLCISGSIINNKCYGKFYHSSMKQDSNKMVECKMEDECKYLDSENNILIEKCNCGYNGDGKGYCTRGYDENENSDWSKLAQYKRRSLKNKCHTMNRFNCKSYHPQIKNLLFEINIKTILAHNLYKSDECVKILFASSLYFQIKVFFIFLVSCLLI